jgi:hypothetical protein
MELNAARFPFPLPPRTIGEQKAKVKRLCSGVGLEFAIYLAASFQHGFVKY